MYKRVKEYIKIWHMINQKDKVIAGVSGGADSICLLFMLLELKKELEFDIAAVHINHGLRKEAAYADEEYVRKVCSAEGVELFVFHEDVKAYAKDYGLTEEEAGRNIRRNRFMEVLQEQGGTCIALAHHMNDNAETVLWNLCRGTGLKGMGGISPKNGIWIRPLLCLNRIEIESYLKKRGISYCTDETNLCDDYIRNRIRNHVIPYLEENINAKSVEHMAKCIEKLRIIGEFVDEETERYMIECTKAGPGGEIILEKEMFESVPEALKSEVIHRIICTVAGKCKDIESVHVRTSQELLKRQVGRKIDLPYETEAVRCYEGLCFQKKKLQPKEVAGRDGFCMQVFERCTESETIPQKTYTKWFDYDIIKNAVKIRHREPGDYIVIDKAGKTQKIKQYFINEKIPQKLRDSIWLVADGKEIIWVVGYRQSQAYQITEKTKRILEIGFYGGERDGRDSKSDDPGRES